MNASGSKASVITKGTIKDWLISPRSITLITEHGSLTVQSTDERFASIKARITSSDQADLDSVYDELFATDKVVINTEGKFLVENGLVKIDGEALPSALSNMLLTLVKEGKDTLPLENFWDKLKDNPTESSRHDLFGFLNANKVPITRDGCFIVYKKVRDDWWDSHTGNSFQSTVGSVVEMPRENVDPNRNNTCSRGLHVAAWDYASTFSGQRLLECKVNPVDVVAVPPDYNQQKMRVCRYLVLREVTDGQPYSEPVYTKKLASDKPLDSETEADHVIINCDKEGRLRIPGKLIRKHLRIGSGKKVGVIIGNERGITLEKAIKKHAKRYVAEYVIQKDNSVRIQSQVIEQVVAPFSSSFNGLGMVSAEQPPGKLFVEM